MRIMLLIIMLLSSPLLAQAATDWADWISGTTSPGLVTGTVAGASVTVTSASVLPSQAGIAGEPIYWKSTPTYISATVENPPTTADIIKISSAQAYTITFGTPVNDPVIAIVSLGGGPVSVDWDFGAQPIRLLSQGPGHFGAGPLSITGNVLTGQEGHGVIQVMGTITAVTFSMKTFENWTGFTVGVPSAISVPVPPVATGLSSIAAGLSWDLYPITNLEAVLVLYRGEDARCDDALPLMIKVSDPIPSTVTEYADRTVPASAIRVCYELQAAWKDAMEMASGPSNRARAIVTDLVPKQPTGVLFVAGSN